MINKKVIYLIILIIIIVTIIFFFESAKVKPSTDKADSIELVGISGYFNTDKEIKLSDFKNKVVLVDFWTYTCINCIRTLPYLVEWDKKYRDKGLVIIGVHTPEFEFEKKYENVQDAIEKYNIKYPVVQDNDYLTWNAFENRYWPHKYLLDKNGVIRYDHIGEGKYDETERKIQELLSELGNDLTDMETSKLEDKTPRLRQTPELYAGYQFALSRGQNIGNKELLQPEQTIDYKLPEKLNPNIIYLKGKWKSNKEDLQAQDGKSSIVLMFTASSVNIVADSINEPLELEVFINDKYVKEQAGNDISFKDNKSFILIDEPRLYNIFNGEHGSYKLTLTTTSKDFNFNAFTFG